MSKHIQIIPGMKFGKLTAIELVKNEVSIVQRDKKWLFKCDCGNTKAILRRDITRKSKPTLTCGCSKTTHGLTFGGIKHYLINIWSDTKQRCFNQNHQGYKYYGSKGILMLEEWANDCAKFCQWIIKNLGERPSNIYVLDRIDKGLGYFPDNLQWIPKSQQLFKRNQVNRNKHSRNPVQVNQYTLDGDYLQTFPSINSAARSLILNPISSFSLSKIIRSKNNKARGYLWRIKVEQD